jgi:hypothetical protein
LEEFDSGAKLSVSMNPISVQFNQDGTKLFVLGDDSGTKKILTVNLGTAYQITTLLGVDSPLTVSSISYTGF